MKIHPIILHQVLKYQEFLSKQGFISYQWDELDPESSFVNEEILISNTYLNVLNSFTKEVEDKELSGDELEKSLFSKESKIENIFDIKLAKHKNKKKSFYNVTWVDQELDKDLASEIPEDSKLINRHSGLFLSNEDSKNNDRNAYKMQTEKSIRISENISEDQIASDSNSPIIDLHISNFNKSTQPRSNPYDVSQTIPFTKTKLSKSSML